MYAAHEPLIAPAVVQPVSENVRAFNSNIAARRARSLLSSSRRAFEGHSLPLRRHTQSRLQHIELIRAHRAYFCRHEAQVDRMQAEDSRS